jgi:hypothetical protein
LKKYLDGTIDYIPFIPNNNVDVHGLSAYSMSSQSNYRVEYNCELYRHGHKETKLYPSRFSCVFAFGDYETCQKVSQLYGWDIYSVRKFKILKLPFTRVVKVNMEVVGLMQGCESSTMIVANEQEKIWKHYWSGAGDICIEVPNASESLETRHSGVIWEYLIEGRIELVD